MINPAGPRSRSVYYVQMEKDLEAYERLLADHDIRIPSHQSSRLQHAILFIARLNRMRVGQESYSKSEDLSSDYREALGLVDLAQKLLRVKDHSSFPTLLPHLRYIHSDEAARSHLNAVVSQNAPGVLAVDDLGNKTFELYCALLLMCFSKDVDLEHPLSPSGGPRNPDVLFRLWQQRWGIACKVPGSFQRQSYLDNLVRGGEQIRESDAEFGFVLLSLRNLLPHHDWLRTTPDPDQPDILPYEVFEDPEEPLRRVDQVCKRIRAFFDQDGVNELLNRGFLRDKRVAPEIIHYVATVSRVRGANGIVLHLPLMFFYCIPIGRKRSGTMRDRLRLFGTTLNRFAQWGEPAPYVLGRKV